MIEEVPEEEGLVVDTSFVVLKHTRTRL